MKPFRLWIYKRLTSWLPESRCYGFKVALLRWAGAKIGSNVRIYSSAQFLGNGDLEIGDDVHIGAGVLLYPTAPATITIGNHVDVGPQVAVLTGSHEIDVEGDHVAGKGTARSVVLSSGSWICARATILPGVSVAEKTLVAAGSVVVRACDRSSVLLAGNPAVEKKMYGLSSKDSHKC